MDITSLLSTVMSANSTGGISDAAGVSNDQTRSILTAALPLLLSGALNQSTGSATASGFASALTQHAASNTSNLSSFLSNVDQDDGEKIVNHLLGANSNDIINQIAKESGVKAKDVKKVLSAAAPLLMSLLGKEVSSQQQSNSSAGVASILGSLLGGGGNSTASLLTGLLGGGSSPSSGTSGGLGSLLTDLLK